MTLSEAQLRERLLAEETDIDHDTRADLRERRSEVLDALPEARQTRLWPAVGGVALAASLLLAFLVMPGQQEDPEMINDIEQNLEFYSWLAETGGANG
jgi:hypothetical protein